jgi:hypothetical protein
MDVNYYLLGALAHERLEAMRAEARAMSLRAAAPPARPLRVLLGELLVKAGHRLASRGAPVRAAA